MSSVRVAIVGAGPSGLAAARTLRTLGCEVTVYESAPDVGGVWSASRAYPGIATQNDKYTYCFTDLGFDDAVDGPVGEAPAGSHMRAYFERFAQLNGLEPTLRLSTRVAAAEPLPDEQGWTFEAHGPGGVTRESADWLIVANGLNSMPYVPALQGRDAFEQAGGAVRSPSELTDAGMLRGRHVLVVGWGKSAGDIATVAAREASEVHVVARTIGWKLPREIRGVSFQRVMLSRVGEHLIWGPHRTFAGRVLRKITQLVRGRVVRTLGNLVADQLELDRRGVRPDLPADQLDHLITDGFLEAIDAGRIAVHRGERVLELGAGGEHERWARLSDGSVVPADVVVVATGYDQDLGLFTDTARKNLVDSEGDLALVRYALPQLAERLAFVGWVNSFRNPISAEMQSLWVAAVMFGLLDVPARAWRTAPVFRLGHDVAAARAVAQLPYNGSFLTVDEWLADLKLRVPLWRRRRELFGPMIPSVYADRLALLSGRIEQARTQSAA